MSRKVLTYYFKNQPYDFVAEDIDYFLCNFLKDSINKQGRAEAKKHHFVYQDMNVGDVWRVLDFVGYFDKQVIDDLVDEHIDEVMDAYRDDAYEEFNTDLEDVD